MPTGHGHPTLFRAGTPYGSATVSHGVERRPPTEDDLAVASYQGERLARVAAALKAHRSEIVAPPD